jgi:hypothetical protein
LKKPTISNQQPAISGIGDFRLLISDFEEADNRQSAINNQQFKDFP